MLTNNKGKIAHWTLSPFYLLALGATVQAAELYELQSRHIILASFDTELNKPSIMPAPVSTPAHKPAAKPEQANEKWQRVLRAHPNDTEALAGLSRYYAQSDKASLARQYLVRLKKANSKHTDIPALERLLGISSPAPVVTTPQKVVTPRVIPDAAAIHEIAKPASTPPKAPQVAKVNPPEPTFNQVNNQPKPAIQKPVTPAPVPAPQLTQPELKKSEPVAKKTTPVQSKPVTEPAASLPLSADKVSPAVPAIQKPVTPAPVSAPQLTQPELKKSEPVAKKTAPVQSKPITEPAASHSLSVADVARISIKQGRSDQALSFLENNKPLNATSTVLYAWALLNTKEDEKLSGLLKEIESENSISDPRLLTQLSEIHKLHAARQPKPSSKPAALQTIVPTAITAQLKPAPQPLSTADTARTLIKQSKNLEAVSFLENNKPLNATSTVLYAWALLNTKEDEKLSGLLKEIESEKSIVETRLQTQLSEIRKLHAARNPAPKIKPAVTKPAEKKLSALNVTPQSSIRLNPLDSAEKSASPVASRQADNAKLGLSQKIFDLKYAAGMTCEAQDYKRCQSMLIELESLGVRDRDILFLRAWNELNQGNHEASGKRFLNLYQALPDKQSAEGLFYSYSQLNRTEELHKIAREKTLTELLKKGQSTSASTQSATFTSALRSESDVLAERRANREKYEPFSTLGISHMDMYFSQRSKTGETGTSRVISRREPGLGYGWRSDDKSTDYRIQIDRVKQNPGVLDPAVAIVGTDAAYGGILAPLPQPIFNKINDNTVNSVLIDFLSN